MSSDLPLCVLGLQEGYIPTVALRGEVEEAHRGRRRMVVVVVAQNRRRNTVKELIAHRSIAQL